MVFVFSREVLARVLVDEMTVIALPVEAGFVFRQECRLVFAAQRAANGI